MSDISYYVKTIPVTVVNEGLGALSHANTNRLKSLNLFISDLTIPIKFKQTESLVHPGIH